MYFEGTLSDSALTKTSKYNFEINATDACRTTTVVSTPTRVLSLPNVEYQVASTDYPYDESAFTDVLDATTSGLCGTKSVVLDAAATTTSFLTLTSNVSPLTFEYNAAATTETDIGTHTVAFTVTHDEYIGVLTPITSSFTFTINCPTLVTSSSLDLSIEPFNDYNVASGSIMDILSPAITVNPAICFSVDSFVVVDAVTSAAAPAFLSVSPTYVSIFTEDRAYVGTHVFSIKAHISNGEILYAHDFQVRIYDPCDNSRIVDNTSFPQLEFKSLQPG